MIDGFNEGRQQPCRQNWDGAMHALWSSIEISPWSWFCLLSGRWHCHWSVIDAFASHQWSFIHYFFLLKPIFKTYLGCKVYTHSSPSLRALWQRLLHRSLFAERFRLPMQHFYETYDKTSITFGQKVIHQNCSSALRQFSAEATVCNTKRIKPSKTRDAIVA